MPRKLFRKYLPSHPSIRENRYPRFCAAALQHHKLWHLHRRSVAGGVAIGPFCGLAPGPMQMLSAALVLLAFILAVSGYLRLITAWRAHVVLAWRNRRR
jgi:uncharacterized protein (DUF2062 family)